MIFNYNDGGREQAGYEGKTGDCVVRAIAIATELPYQKVYDDLFEANKKYAAQFYGRVAKRIRESGGTPRNGTFREVYEEYLKSIGWIWKPCMIIGSGCKVHLKAEELPKGRLIVRVSKHVTCVIDGVLNDTWDCSREETRCVYGYYTKEDACQNLYH